MNKIVIIGAGGLGREVECIINAINLSGEPIWDVVGFIDDNVPVGEHRVVGNVDSLNKWTEEIDVVIAIGNPKAVRIIADKLTNPMLSFPNIIAPGVIFTAQSRVKMGRGNIFAFQTLISCDIEIGNFNLFNGFITVGHDVRIGSYNSIMPSVNISGEVAIGDGNFFGVGSIILQGLKVGNHIKLGAGSVLMRNSKDDNLYMGNPATIVKF